MQAPGAFTPEHFNPQLRTAFAVVWHAMCEEILEVVLASSLSGSSVRLHFKALFLTRVLPVVFSQPVITEDYNGSHQ